jgi:hypothetical protein
MSLYETGVRQLIDDYLIAESKKVRDYGEYWSASSAGYCMRKVIFERLGVPKNSEDARRQRVFTSGHIFHNWIQEITKAAGVSIAQEVELQDEDLMIRGHFDDLILVADGYKGDPSKIGTPEPSITPNNKLILYDYKTVNSRSFMWAKKNGNAMSHFHRLQLGTYMYMLREFPSETPLEEWEVGINRTLAKHKVWELTEARILKIEKDTLMMGEQKLEWTPDLERDVVQYWKTLNGYWKKQTLPKCTCADYEGGFMAKKEYNGYYYNEEPCSLEYYKTWKEGQREAVQTPTT